MYFWYWVGGCWDFVVCEIVIEFFKKMVFFDVVIIRFLFYYGVWLLDNL